MCPLHTMAQFGSCHEDITAKIIVMEKTRRI
jgi:hypothetical protein